MAMMPLVLKQLQSWDERRSGVPGEHWAAFGLGLALLQAAGPGRPTWLRVAAAVGGAAMIWRAASGRDGFLRELQRSSAQAPAVPQAQTPSVPQWHETVPGIQRHTGAP